MPGGSESARPDDQDRLDREGSALNTPTVLTAEARRTWLKDQTLKKDRFLELCLNGNIPCVTLILHIILNRTDLVYRPRISYTLTVLKFELLHPHWDPHPPNAISSDTLLDQH